jgi:hypothetical protein
MIEDGSIMRNSLLGLLLLFIVSPSEAVFVTSEDGHVVRIVAVSTKSGESYLLAGFKNAALEFNRLVRDAVLRISSNNDAQQYARFYFTVVADPQPRA